MIEASTSFKELSRFIKDMDVTKEKLSAAGSSLSLLKKLKAKEDESSLFMSSFDPTVSRTAKLDKKKKKKKKMTDPRIPMKDVLYDEKGILLSNGVDLCDCLDLKVCYVVLTNIVLVILIRHPKCPGCHFNCPECGSGKCGHECRIKRTWVYESVEFEGQQEARVNPFNN